MVAHKSGDEYDDDPSIPPKAQLLRRIPPWQLPNVNGGGEAPRSDAFSNHPDGSGTSVDILEDDWSPEKTLAGYSSFGLVSILAEEVRSVGLGVIRARIPNNPHHAHIQGKKTKSIKRQLAKHCRWIREPPQRG